MEQCTEGRWSDTIWNRDMYFKRDGGFREGNRLRVSFLILLSLRAFRPRLGWCCSRCQCWAGPPANLYVYGLAFQPVLECNDAVSQQWAFPCRDSLTHTVIRWSPNAVNQDVVCTVKIQNLTTSTNTNNSVIK